MNKNVLVVTGLVLVMAVFVMIGISRKGAAGTRQQIAVIPKGTTHAFWQAVHNGACKAGEEFDVDILWNGPEREGAREKQIQIIEDFITRKVAGVVLAPGDSVALVPSVENMQEQGMPCVIFDSGIDTDKYISFVATDNYEGGAIGARRMGKILNGKGNVIVVKYMAGSTSTTKRENGFIETIEKEFPGIKIVDAKYGMDTVETSLQATEDLLMKNKKVDGLFAVNESTSVGALRALQSQGRAGKVKMIGFDENELLKEAIRSGDVDSLVVQNPERMGYLAVKIILEHIGGKKVEKFVDTGVSLMTKEEVGTRTTGRSSLH